MELRHLRYFVAVAEAGTVSAAAKRLNTSQPSLSRQVHDLEATLGVALFERVGRRLQLTGAGETLLDKARVVLREAEDLREQARGLRHGDVGVLRVGATPQTIERIFPRLLERFAEVKPGVEVRLSEGDSSSLSDLLRDGAVHMVLTAYIAEWAASARILGRLPILAVSAESLGDSDQLELRALRGRPLLLFQRGFGSRDLFDAACRMAHMEQTIYLESRAPRTLLALAKAGRGVAVFPPTVMPVSGAYHVYVLAHEGVPLEVGFAVHWNPERHFPTYAEAFLDELTAIAAEEFSSDPARWRTPRDRTTVP